MHTDLVINIEGVSKVYSLYDHPFDRVKDALYPGKRLYHTDFHALSDVSFKLNRGETLGIIGRNGSGKSTLLKILAGVLTPTAGDVTVKGRVSSLLELGAGFNPELTGINNIYLQGTLMGFSRAEMTARIPDITAFANIGAFINQPVKHYSSGMFVRLAFACAIHVEPEVLIVDEALAVGDIEFQQKSYQAMCQLKKAGVSILLVSHDLGSIVEFCSLAMLLDHGKSIAYGKPGEVVNKFKQLLSTNSTHTEPVEATPPPREHASRGGEMKSKYERDVNADEYGGAVVTIQDWGVLDNEGNPSSIIDNDDEVEILMVLRFNRPCQKPIIGYFLTDTKGREIVGTNTDFEGIEIGVRKPGDVVQIRFKQKIAIAAGSYFLNIGCSEYIDGKTVAHHRIYNLTTLTILSKKRFVGFCTLNPAISVETLSPSNP